MLSLIVTALAAKTVLLFGGDIMLSGISPSPHVLEGIRKLTAQCDLSFANLEIPLTNATTKTPNKSPAELERKDQWILKADPKHAQFIRQCGITMVTLANNHAMDYGKRGLEQMIQELDANKIHHAGADRNSNAALRPSFSAVKGHKTVALLSVLAFVTPSALRKTTPATLNSAGVAVLSFGGTIGERAKEKLSRWISSARAKADIVIVGVHWGIERKPIPSPYQVTLGRAMIDAGADVVWGNHPHVLQGAEMYKKHLIMYSMGNLISNLPAQTGFFKLEFAADGSQTARFFPGRDAAGRVSLLKAGQREAAYQKMKALCRLLLHRYPSTVSAPAL